MLALMYHRVGRGKHANSLEMLKEHLLFVKERYSVVLPGDPLERSSICLTFDDASYDFYVYIYPLLKELNLKALLGVPVRYILDNTTLAKEERLSIPYHLAMQDSIFDQKAPFCTWKELIEMVSSGHVEVASHSYSHSNLTFSFVDLEKEVVRSKEILEALLPQAITSFIYPFGRWTPKLDLYIQKHYFYRFRIGSRMNRSWEAKHPLSRVPADQMKSASALFTLKNRFRYTLKSLV